MKTSLLTRQKRLIILILIQFQKARKCSKCLREHFIFLKNQFL